MLSFISFGSGSSGNCYCLFTGTDALMIDAGIGVRGLRKAFRDKGLSTALVHNLLITHDHADHVKSVGSLSHEWNIPVYATREVHEGIERNYYVHRKVSRELKRYIEKNAALQVGEFKVTPFAVPHDSDDCVGYSIEHEGVTFCLVTDAGHITPAIARHIARADYLVIEANHDEKMLWGGIYPEFLKRRISGRRGHLSNDACGKAIADNMTDSLRGVWLCHLSEENNHPELARKTVEAILHSRGIEVGSRLSLEVLGRKTPSEVFVLSANTDKE